MRDELARRLATLRRCAAAVCRLGPRLAARLAYRRGARGCARSSVRATLVGIDARRVSRVEFRVGGKLQGADVRAPFRRVLARRVLRRQGTTIRLRAQLTDGHVVTYDRRVRACVSR